MTASAVRVGDRSSEYAKRQAMPWQTRTFSYLDLVPEIDFSSRIYARMLKQLVIFPALLDDQGKKVRIENGEPVDVLDRIQDPGGGRSGILGNYGRLMFLPGEGTLFGRDLNTTEERWSFLWNDELKIETTGEGGVRSIEHKPGGATQGIKYAPDRAVAYRFWTPHPKDSGHATSPMRAALDIAEELVILTKAVRATAVTRMLNGIFIVPQEISPGSIEPLGDEDPLNDPFAEDIADQFEKQIDAIGTASAAVPYVIFPPYDYSDRIRWIQLHDPASDYLERDLRKEAVERLARGFDFPPEILLGLSAANHWSAKQILDDLFRAHGAPLALQFCNQLADVYLRPTLRDMGYADWVRVVVDFDSSAVTNDIDRFDDAAQAHDRLAISDQALRDAGGWTEADAPSEQEYRERAAIKIRDAVIVEGGSGVAPAPSKNGNQPPAPGPEGDSGRLTRVTASLELGAAQVALVNCRKIAGMRIRNKARWQALETACEDCAKAAQGKPHHLVASTVGAEVLVELGAEPRSLVEGGTDIFRLFLTERGFTDNQIEELCEMVENYAARTLYEEKLPELPSGFQAHLLSMKEVNSALRPA